MRLLIKVNSSKLASAQHKQGIMWPEQRLRTGGHLSNAQTAFVGQALLHAHMGIIHAFQQLLGCLLQECLFGLKLYVCITILRPAVLFLV